MALSFKRHRAQIPRTAAKRGRHISIVPSRLSASSALGYVRRSEMAESQEEIDKALLARAASGDQAAFAQLYDRLRGPLYSLAVRILGDAAEAQDALQDVFLQIWRRAAKYDAEQSSVFSWAMLMTRSRVIDRLRARGRRSRPSKRAFMA